MKAWVTKKVEIDVKSILIDIAPRYIGDSEDDDMPTDMPLLQGESWRALVNVDTGQIEGWPIGEEREFCVKVCDSGIYTLFDSEYNQVAQIADYVPNGIVPGEYGDYVNMKIGSDGIIKNWPATPNLNAFFVSDE